MVGVVAFFCTLALSPAECGRARVVDIIAIPPDRQMRRPRPRALTRPQERLFFALAFGLGALLQLAVLL